MNTQKRTGRLIGALLLTAMLLGLWNNFFLTNPIFAGAGWLQNGARMPGLFGASALLGIVTSSLTLTAAIVVWPILRKYAPALALGFLLLSAIGFATSAVEQANFLSLRSLSLQYAGHSGRDPALFDILRGMAMANRYWIHYIDKLIGGGSMLVLYVALFRSNLVPRFVPALGMLAVPIQMTGISLELFLQDMPMVMLAPIALMQLVLCLTLLARGFAEVSTTEQIKTSDMVPSNSVNVNRRDQGR
jgi:hypothetical protein